MKIVSFTENGTALALKIAGHYAAQAERCKREEGWLSRFTQEAFSASEALIFVGAAGIAVRSIAPFLKNKAKDPAVLVVDETGRFVIPILSGHLGGANALARELADYLGAEAVITTATDCRGVFAVDCWAKSQGCELEHREAIRLVSGKLLNGEKAVFYSESPISGRIPDGIEEGTAEACDFAVTIHELTKKPLLCIPKILVLGIGCRKGTEESKIEACFQTVFQNHQLLEKAVCKVCSIDCKKEEAGLLAFCRTHGWQLQTFSADELKKIPGDFTYSEFVENTVGVGNVCERSAVAGSSEKLLVSKTAQDGVTMAVAGMPYWPAWE